VYSTRKNERFVYAVIGASIIGVILIGLIAYYQFFRIPAVERTAREAALLETDVKNGTEVDVFVVRDNIEQGKKLDLSKLKVDMVKISTDILPADVVKSREALQNKIAKIDIPKNTIILQSMLVAYDSVVTSDLRRQDFSNIRLPYNLVKGDYVDVRIKRLDGSDDIVLSKKEILDVAGTTICVNINESERQLLNEASVEAKIKRAELYATLYIDAQNQPPAATTYRPDEKILTMIKQNPDMVDQALAPQDDGSDTRQSTNLSSDTTSSDSTSGDGVSDNGAANDPASNDAQNIDNGDTSNQSTTNNGTAKNTTGNKNSSSTNGKGNSTVNNGTDNTRKNDAWVDINKNK